MAEARERVVIEVEIDADISNDLAAIESRLKALEERQNALNRATRGAAGANRDFDATSRRVDKAVTSKTRRFDRFRKVMDRTMNGLKKLTGALQKFLTTFAKLSFIAIAAEIAVFTAGLLAVKALLITGRVAVQGYNLALKGLSVTAAGIAAGLSVAAAAIREFQEVQLTPFFGGGQQGARGARQLTRSFTSQTRSLLGESTGAVAGSFAQAGIRRGNILASQLFNLSGGDAKAVQSLAAAFASAQKSGDTAGLITALQGARGFRADSIAQGASLGSIVSTVSRGGATADSFQGLAEAFAGTFIGTLKAEAESFKGIFANIGEPLLKPFRDSFLQISQIIRNDVLGIAQIMREFGPDSMAPALVGFTDAVSDFIRSNIVQNVSNIAGAADKFIDFFRSVGNFFTGFGDWLRSYEGAADVVIEMFKAMFGRSAGGLFRDFSNLIEDNKETFIGFGQALGNVLNAIKQGFLSGNRGFFGSLPKLTNTLNVVASSVLPNLYEVFGAIAPLFESFPEIIRDVSEKLGPMLVRIFEAMKPIFDRLPDAFSGLLSILTKLEPLIMLLIKAVDLLLTAISFIPGGDMLMGLMALNMLGGPAGGFFKQFGGRTGKAMASAGSVSRSASAAGAGAGARAGAARVGSSAVGGAAGAADDVVLRMAYSNNPAIRSMGNALLNNTRTAPMGSGLRGATQRFLDNGRAGSVSLTRFLTGQGPLIHNPHLTRLQQFGFNARLMNSRSIPLGRFTLPIPQMTMPGERINQAGLNLMNRASAMRANAGARFANRFPGTAGRLSGISAGNVASKAFGGYAAFQTIRDFRNGGVNQLYNQMADNPLGAALQYGGAASLVGLGAPIGGATAAVGSIINVNRNGLNTGNVLTGLGGSAIMAGALGAGPIGVIGAMLVTGIGMAVANYARGKRIRKNAEQLGDSILDGIGDAFRGGEIKNGFTDAQRNMFAGILEAGNAALEAGTNDKLERVEGDTRAMREFILQAQGSGLLAGTKFENMALSEIHLDNFLVNELEPILNEIQDRMVQDEKRRLREEAERVRLVEQAMNRLVDTLDVTRRELEMFVEDFGIALDTANLAGVSTLFELYNAPMIDLAQGFLPDLTTTTAYGMEAKASANAALNALADADKLGQYNTADLQEFINNYTSTEVAFGGNAAVSGLSAIMELRRQVETGALSQEFAQMFNLDQLLANTAQELATGLGVPIENIMAAVRTGDVDNVTAYLTATDRTREIARAGVFGTGTRQQRNDFVRTYGDELVNDQKFREILLKNTPLDRTSSYYNIDDLNYRQLLNRAVAEGTLDTVMQAYLTEVGDGTDTSNQLLQGIIDAVEGVAPMVSIDGEPATRVSQNGSEYSFTITVAPASTEG